MSQRQGPNPVELYEAAVQYMVPVIAGIPSERMEDRTPCTEWNVRALVNHNIRVARFAHSVLSGARVHEPMWTMDVDGPLPAEGAVEAFVGSTSRVLEAVKAAGALDSLVDTGFGETPAGRFLMAPIADLVIHKWDLATATGQDTSIDGVLADSCYDVLVRVVDAARQGGFFGPEVDVPMTAGIQEKLQGLSGRGPWH